MLLKPFKIKYLREKKLTKSIATVHTGTAHSNFHDITGML